MRRSFSRLTIGSTNYPKQCSATYCRCSQCTPSGMIKTCATSLRTIPTSRCVRITRATTRERALTPTIRWDFDYTRDEPPVVQRLAEEPRHSTPRADPKTPSERPRPALELPRPRASLAPPSSHPAKRMALNYLPVTEEITPPITPPRAQAKEIDTAT